MFIDIHAHAYRADCPPADGTTRFANPAEVIARYDELGIDRGLLLPLIGPETYLPQSNEDILDMAAASGGRFIPCCNIDPRGMGNHAKAPLDIWLKHYKERGCKAVGEVMPNLPFADPRCQNLFSHMEALELPLIFDITDRVGGPYGFADDAGLPQLEMTLQCHPKLKIFGHGPAFWAEIARLETPGERTGYPKTPVREEGVVPILMRRYPNLYGDLSAGSGFGALWRDREYAVRFLNEFHERLCFGTDICYAAHPLPLAGFLIELRDGGHLPQDAFDNIAFRNAERLFDL